MSVPVSDPILQELVVRGLITANPAPRALATGNGDRRSDQIRRSWFAYLPDGSRVKLTTGRSLGSLPGRHAAFAQACPGIATRQLLYANHEVGDALIEEYFDGLSLEQALRDQALSPAMLGAGLSLLRQALAATEQPSTEEARSQEWQSWSRELLNLEVWSPTEAKLLADVVLPRLYQRIASAPPVTRWTNGDYLPSNILINPEGVVRLIDMEFAGRTHFFREDAIRFRVLGAAAGDLPEIENGLPVSPDLAWHLHFWLRQFQLEVTQNTPAYFKRYRACRMGVIRHLAERLLDVDMNGWSEPTPLLAHRVEDIRWEGDLPKQAVITGWCVPAEGMALRRVAAFDAKGRLLGTGLPAPRPDVQQFCHGRDEALHSGFRIAIPQATASPRVSLCAILDPGTLLPLCDLTSADFPAEIFWDTYPEWAEKHDPDPVAPATSQPIAGGNALFSILLPVYNTPVALLSACVRSVQRQFYQQWELCLVDDGSDHPGLAKLLEALALEDARIRVKSLRQNGGISRATNAALDMAKGPFCLLLDHDDLLRPHTLSEIAAVLARHPDWDAVYTDEDKISEEGRRTLPFFKPDFSPEFLKGVMYAGHALCVRTTVARLIGGFDPAFDGVQDYEFLLRFTEHTRRIGHLPRILYHWRQTATSSALHGNIKGDMDERQAAAVREHLRRIGDSRQVIATGGHRVRLEPSAVPGYTLLPFAPGPGLLGRLRQAAALASEEILIVLPPDMPVESQQWPDKLAALAALPDSGCVAPIFTDSNHRVREAGRAHGTPLMHGFHVLSDGYHGSLCCNREVDAVSPACFAIRRNLLLDLPADVPAEWTGFLRWLRLRKLFHRTCAAARITLPREFALSTESKEGPAETLEFLNPHFDAARGDYRLAAGMPVADPTAHQVRFNIDQPAQWNQVPRSLIIRGWCFTVPHVAIRAVRLQTDTGLILTGVFGLPRPDVKAALADAPDMKTGFEIRGTLPSGRLQLSIEVLVEAVGWKTLDTRRIIIPWRFLPLWLGGGTWQDLMFFQMPAHMAYPPRRIAPESYPPRQPARAPIQLSIVTPSYNQIRFLPETMRSVLDQDVRCEYIVQDGGSTDGSGDYIKGQAARLTAWRSERDLGQADAIAKGFSHSSGGPDGIMAWLNSDDFYLPGALAYVADFFARHPEVDVLYGNRILVDEESREIGRWFLPQHDPEVLRLNDFVPQETLFWRRRIWDKVGGIDASFQFAMDWDLLLRFQEAGATIRRVPYFLACFRIHAAQKTSAQMHSVGQDEITRLRERTFGRAFPPRELETHPVLLRYLRRSAFIEFAHRWGVRLP